MINDRNLHFFLMDGSPSGIVQCTMDLWPGIGYKIPRSDLSRCKDMDELNSFGVYFLFGKSENEEDDVIYVGRGEARQNGEGVLARLQAHDRDPDKDYWTEAVAFTTRDNSFGPSEIYYLEHRFYVLATEAKNYKVKNGNVPSPGKVSPGMKSSLERFIEDIKVIVGMLGYSAFEKPSGLEFFIKHRGGTASGRRTGKGFIVLGGSCTKDMISNIPPSYKYLREKYAGQIDAGGKLVDDIVFSSPSAAASFVLGAGVNGLATWKTADGRTLKDVLGEGIGNPVKPFSSAPASQEIMLHIKHGGGDAGCKWIVGKSFIVLAGSYIKNTIADSMSPGYRSIRQQYASQIDGNGKLSQDVYFQNSSAAASFVLGRTANGRVEWKTEDGKTLGEILKEV